MSPTIENIIDMQGISIAFGQLKANDKVDFTVRKGEIMALLGENGAGKSTLMKILYGLYVRDAGSLTVDGHKMPHKFSPMDMINLGVSLVPQQFMLVEAFTVAENIILGEEKAASRFVFNKKKAEAVVQALCEKFDIPLDVSECVADLPLVKKQKIEILKALYRGSKVIILDEPTTILTPQEVGELFDLLRRLKSQGVSVVLIAHKLQEVMDITDRVSVMRLGQMVATVNTKDTSIRELAATMVGKEMETLSVDFHGAQGEPVVTFHGVTTQKEEERCPLQDFSLTLHPGCIVGIAGIDGNGQTELVEVLAGIKPIQSGSITFKGHTLTTNDHQVMSKLGIAIIPEDRREQGLVLDLSVKDNILIGHRDRPEFASKRGVFKSKAVKQFVTDVIREFDVRPAQDDLHARSFSGGNQQKVVLGRELSRPNLNLVVASQPIRGLDIGAIDFTHKTLLKHRDEGKAVLLISSDLDEVREMSDYIAVLCGGKIVAFRPNSDFTVEEIGLFMGGVAHDEKGETPA